MLTFSKVDESYIKVDGNNEEIYDLAEHLSKFTKGYEWSQSYKDGKWDGKIRFLNKKTKKFYQGLLEEVKDFCKNEKIEYKVLFNEGANYKPSTDELEKFFKSLNLTRWDDKKENLIPCNLHDFQFAHFKKSLEERKLFNVLKTAGGKSLIIYLLVKYLMKDGKILILVDQTQLASQLYDNFIEYGWNDIENYCHKMFFGQEKTLEKPVTISTWQTLMRFDKDELIDYIQDMKTFILDEAHILGSDSDGIKFIKILLENAVNCENRFGFTGTMKMGSPANEASMKGLIGKTFEIMSYQDLLDREVISQYRIKVNILKYIYPKRFLEWTDEREYVENNDERKNILAEKLSKTDKNQLVLINIKEYGKNLKRYLFTHKLLKDKKIVYIDGDIKPNDRKSFVNELEKKDNMILIATIGTFQKGINVKNLHKIHLWSTFKKESTLLQSLGRGIRKYPDKILILEDYIDIIPGRENNKLNWLYNHGLERLKVYKEENFKVKSEKFKICNKEA